MPMEDAGEQRECAAMEALEAHIVSSTVQRLATEVYAELDMIVRLHGRGSVDSITPLIINILSTVDEFSLIKRQNELEMHLVQSEKEDLLLQLQRQKSLRRSAEERATFIEDETTIAKRTSENKMEELASLTRLLQVKNTRAMDTIALLEKKDATLRQELTCAHNKYTELLRNHVACIERLQEPTDKTSHHVATATSTASNTSSFERISEGKREATISPSNTVTQSIEFECNDLVIVDPTNIAPVAEPQVSNETNQFSSTGVLITSFLEPNSFLGDDCSDYEVMLREAPSCEADDEADDLFSTATSSVHDQLTSFEHMRREIEKLIAENDELIQTKNALNYLKDDLLTRVGDLTDENLFLRGELCQSSDSLSKSKQHVMKLQQQLRFIEGHIRRLSSQLLTFKDMCVVPQSSPLLPCSPPTGRRHSFCQLSQSSVLMALPCILSRRSNSLPAPGRRSGASASWPDRNLSDSFWVHRKVSVADRSPAERRRPLLGKRDQCSQIPPRESNPSSGGLFKQKVIASKEATVEKTEVEKALPRFTRREMARAIVERNFYKEKYMDLRDAMRGLHQPVTQSLTPSRVSMEHNHTESHHSSGFSFRPFTRYMKRSLHHVVTGLQDLFVEEEPRNLRITARHRSSDLEPRPSPSTNIYEPKNVAYVGLADYFGNLIGQAVTYTAEAVIGTGNDLSRDAARIPVANGVNAVLSSRDGLPLADDKDIVTSQIVE